MGRIQQLPARLRSTLDELLRAGATQKSILGHLNPLLIEHGIKPLSAGGLNRYASKMEFAGRRIREAREIAEVWTAKFGEAPTSDLSQHIINMLRTMAFEFALNADGQTDDEGNPVIDPQAINELALAVQRMERAAQLSTQREKELRLAFADEAEKVGKKQGLTADAAAAMRAALVGDLT